MATAHETFTKIGQKLENWKFGKGKHTGFLHYGTLKKLLIFKYKNKISPVHLENFLTLCYIFWGKWIYKTKCGISKKIKNQNILCQNLWNASKALINI